MKQLTFLFFAFLLNTIALAAVQTKYIFTIDLVQVQNDKVMVSLIPPALNTNEIVYNIPRMVPGTYSVDNFGRYLSDFKAFDKKGNLLPVTKLDDNRWKINQAYNLSKITYWVDDTFEAPSTEHQIFEPTGTNIEDNNFLINTHGFMGYFDTLKNIPYEVTFLKKPTFYGSTALEAVRRTENFETYLVPTYMELVDSPLMFTIPDTTTMQVGGAKILISVYSPTKKATASGIAPMLSELLQAQKNYLGGKLPVQKYAFLLYLTNKPNNSGATGALEHSYSSVYYMRERDTEEIANQLRDIAAHEFFHIVTPLNIHAEQIHNFDYNNPEMSEHLWLYEGTTEYAATHVQVNQKLISPEDYLDVLRKYIISSESYNDTLPFTQMSKGALDKYANQYGNVYQKGALIGLALDIKLRELSGGNYGLRNLMVDLSKTYGKNKGFRDEELFDKIAALTYPEVRTFLIQYVAGSRPLPYADIFKTVGVKYSPKLKEKRQTAGGIGIGFDHQAGKLLITNAENLNAFGKKMGYRTGDQLLAINNQILTLPTLQSILKEQILEAEEGTKVTVLVGRKNSKGEVQEVKLKGKLMKTEEDLRHVLTFAEDATPQQKILRDNWLFGNL